MRERPGTEILFIGTERQVDRDVLGGHPFQTAAIRCQGLKGKSLSGIFTALWQLPKAVWQAQRILRGFAPRVVLGVGGYVTGPVLVAARLLGIPTCIHEQNSVPGLANRLLGRIVERIFISLPGSEEYFPANRTILTGNPIRESIAEIRSDTSNAPSELVLLVLGGSQGARRVNQLVSDGLVGAREQLPPGFRVIHQTGSTDAAEVGNKYKLAGIKATVAPFFTDMASLYQQAVLVISRAGATSLAEICLVGCPAILIPYPFAADNHQEKNGAYVVAGGGALMFLENELTAEQLAGTVMQLLANHEARTRMAECLRGLAMPRATDTIVAECLTLGGVSDV